MLRANLWFSFFIFFSFVFTHSASAQSCGGTATILGGSNYLYASVLDRAHSRYLAYRQGDILTVSEIQRSNGIQIQERFEIQLPAGIEISTAFSGGYLVLSYHQNGQVSGDNVSSDTLSTVRFYRLSDGLLDQAKTFAANSALLLPPQMPLAPFYQSQWQFADWQAPLCSGNLPYGSQQGRLVTAAGSGTIVAHHAEQYNACNPNQNYYRYRLNSNGTPLMRAVRTGRDSQGNPIGTVLCDLQAGFPQVASCLGLANDTCQALNAQGAPVTAPGACIVRTEPTPILASEHCPSCEYWWYELDPGGIIRRADGSYTRFSFPPSIGDPNDPDEEPVSPERIRLGPITALSADPESGAFALALRTDVSGMLSRHTGGIFFFDAGGNYTGFGSSYGNNGNIGEQRSLIALGSLASGEVAFAAGSGRNIPAGSGGFNIPAEFQSEFRPQGGHVSYFSTDGSSFEIDFGEQANDKFGTSLAALGDMNLDGQPDILVGAPGGGYASIIAVAGRADSSARGTLYKLHGSAAARFGQQVAALSLAGNGRADILVVADQTAIYLYDMGNCLYNAEPLLGLRARLRRLVPQAESALAPIPPRRADRQAVNRPSLEVHPAVRQFFFLIAGIWDALDASNQTLPSNEQQRKVELEAAYLAINGSLNTRDRNMILLQRIQPNLQQARRRCPYRNWRRVRTSACRTRRQLEDRARGYQTLITQNRANITEAKAVAVRNLSEIRSELQ